MNSNVQFKMKPESLQFPKLMTHKESGGAVLFIKEGIGIHLSPTRDKNIGESDTFTDMYSYEDFYGTVTPSN